MKLGTFHLAQLLYLIFVHESQCALRASVSFQWQKQQRLLVK